MRKYLGLDIGVSSVGWALIEHNYGEDTEKREGNIIAAGSRIIPMAEDEINNFNKGTTITKAAERRQSRMARRLLQRYRLRRTRLIWVLKHLQWLPESFPLTFKGLEKYNINDFLPVSDQSYQEALQYFNTKSVSQDWLVYFLKKKSLTEKLTKEELARILYHYNQRRGYKSTRKERRLGEEAEKKADKEIAYLTIQSITEVEKTKKGATIFEVKANHPTQGLITGSYAKNTKPDWENKVIELEVTTKTLKDGSITFSLREPEKSEWQELKTAFETILTKSGFTVSEFFLNEIRQNHDYVIKNHIFDRKFYIQEFRRVLECQTQYYPELTDLNTSKSIAPLLYKHNVQKQQLLSSTPLKDILESDIIYFQRSLKSQKHSIANCTFEVKEGQVTVSNEKVFFGVKVAPKSTPLFQEFRIWQFINNLKIYKESEIDAKGRVKTKVDYTAKLFTVEIKESIFDYCDERKEVEINKLYKIIGVSDKEYTFNYPNELKIKGNETKHFFKSSFDKFKFDGTHLLSNQTAITEMWHLCYSVDEEATIARILKQKYHLPEDVAIHISNKALPLDSQYASVSTKALKKILPLMRIGKYWDKSELPNCALSRFNRVLTGETIEGEDPKDAIENILKLEITSESQLRGMQTHVACYVVYGRHSERLNTEKYESYEQIQVLKSGTLRNPVVEQITNETLRVVKDIWRIYGRPDFINIELARELKKNTDERKKIFDRQSKNKRENERIVQILEEYTSAYKTDPNSISQANKLKIWKDTSPQEAPDKKDITSYKNWEDQAHISPYTGKPIPLSKLFTPDYEIEHIIPRSRFFDNSFSNKTICETEINKLKGDRTAFEFIQEFGGTTQNLGGKAFRILTMEEYLNHIETYVRPKNKRRFELLRMEDIPHDFVERQLNDTRYITRTVASLLYPIATDSIIFTSGEITSELKEKWGLHKAWKDILLPRFQELEKVTGKKFIEKLPNNDYKFTVEHKRIDHRHHCLDAIIIALTSRSIIQYFNTLNATDKNAYFRKKYLLNNSQRKLVLPWATLVPDVKQVLSEVIVAHKITNKVLIKRTNKYEKWVLDETTQTYKKAIQRQNGVTYGLRFSLFKEPLGIVKIAEKKSVKLDKAIETQLNFILSGAIPTNSRIAERDIRKVVSEVLKNTGFVLEETKKYFKENPLLDIDGNALKSIDIIEFNEWAAKRTFLNEKFGLKQINKIPYAYHSKLALALKNHLQMFDNDSKKAFEGEGLEQFHTSYGKKLTKVVTMESIGRKIKSSDGTKLAEPDKGANNYFIINCDSNKNKRNYYTPNILDVINSFKDDTPLIEKESRNNFVLSPGNLVKVVNDANNQADIKSDNIYKVVRVTKSECYFVKHTFSFPIDRTITDEDKKEKEREKTADGVVIKNNCLKLNVDRLGRIISVLKE